MAAGILHDHTSVQDLAEGQTLAQLVKSGWRGGQEDVTSIACKLLAVLDYLASRLPPVIHRCCSPAWLLTSALAPSRRNTCCMPYLVSAHRDRLPSPC